MRALLASALLLHACARGDLPPDAAYRAFARATAERDGDAAWVLLSADSRAWLARRARAAAAAAPGVVSDSPQRLLFGDAAVRPPREIEILSADGAVARLRVVDGAGRAAVVRMVREGGTWKVDVPEPL